MKTVCKKLLSLMLVAVLLVSAVPMMASATSAAGFQLTLLPNYPSTEGQAVCNVYADGTADFSSATATVDLSVQWVNVADGSNVTAGTVYTSAATLAPKTVYDAYVASQHVHSFDTYVRTDKAATCTETGTDIYRCSCGLEEPKTTDALGHKWNDGEVIVEATASADGTKLYTCNVCGSLEKRSYSADTITINFMNSYVSTNPVSYTFVLNKTMSIPAGTPIAGYTFKGWFSDTNGEGTQLTDGTTCTNNLAFTYYAYYIKDVKFDYDVYLNIYTNNKVDAPAKRINITSGIAADGVVSLSEVKSVVQNYYTSKDSNGITYDGLYMATGDWVDKFNRNDKEDTFSNIGDLKEQDNVFINVMITNVKEKTSSSSGSTADSSNPKTGDGIYTTVAVFGLSVASLAAVYYIGKKRFAC